MKLYFYTLTVAFFMSPDMNTLPVELVLKILQKTDVSTSMKLKYLNRRLSAIMVRYMYDAIELRIGEKKESVILYSGREVETYPRRNITDDQQNIGSEIKNKLVFVERLHIEGGQFLDQRMLQFELNKYPKLQSTRHLEIRECAFGEWNIFTTFLQKFRVESMKIVANMYKIHTFIYLCNIWQEMVVKDITLKHISVSSINQNHLNEWFLSYMRLKKVYSLQLTGFFQLYEFEILLKAIQEALYNGTPVNWSITFDHMDQYRPYFLRLRMFLEDKNLAYISISECCIDTICEAQKNLSITFPGGHVNFILPSSYIKWSQINRNNYPRRAL